MSTESDKDSGLDGEYVPRLHGMGPQAGGRL
jgi:hypothetical protein